MYIHDIKDSKMTDTLFKSKETAILLHGVQRDSTQSHNPDDI